MLKIRFQGRRYLFTGDSLDQGGAITTREAYVHGEVSYAHLMTDGKIRRFGKIIGTWADIKILGSYQREPRPTIAGFCKIVDRFFERSQAGTPLTPI